MRLTIFEVVCFVLCVVAIGCFFGEFGCNAVPAKKPAATKPAATKPAVQQKVSDTLLVKRGSDGTKMKAKPETLRKVVFWLGDAVWPTWCESKSGRRIYLEYADGCADGEIDIANHGFLDRGWCVVKRHLEVDGVKIEAME